VAVGAGPVLDGFADGSPPFGAGPVIEGFADGAPPYGSGSLFEGATETDPPNPTSGLMKYGSQLTVVGAYKIGGVDGVDLTTIATPHLFLVPDDQTAVICYVVLRCKTAVGVTVPAKVGIGTNVGEDDLFAPRVLYGLNAADKAYIFIADGGGVRVGSLTSIRLGIDEGATATSQTADVDLMGYVF
jgi:hypothetical protein